MVNLIAYFDGSEKERNAYIGFIVKNGDETIIERTMPLEEKTNNGFKIETSALYELMKYLKQNEYKHVFIKGDNEELINRIINLKKRIEKGSYTPKEGFKRSKQFQIIEWLGSEPTWNLERVNGFENEAHVVARRYLYN